MLMQCQECNERPATVHYTQFINNQLSEVHVCEVCAKEKGYMSDVEADNHSIHDLLAGLFNFDKAQVEKNKQQSVTPKEAVKCPNCGMNFAQFKRIGKFGCATCYHSFAPQIEPIL